MYVCCVYIHVVCMYTYFADVCVYVLYMYVYTCVHIHECVYICIFDMSTYVYKWVCICVCKYAYTPDGRHRPGCHLAIYTSSAHTRRSVFCTPIILFTMTSSSKTCSCSWTATASSLTWVGIPSYPPNETPVDAHPSMHASIHASMHQSVPGCRVPGLSYKVLSDKDPLPVRGTPANMAPEVRASKHRVRVRVRVREAPARVSTGLRFLHMRAGAFANATCRPIGVK